MGGVVLGGVIGDGVRLLVAMERATGTAGFDSGRVQKWVSENHSIFRLSGSDKR